VVIPIISYYKDINKPIKIAFLHFGLNQSDVIFNYIINNIND